MSRDTAGWLGRPTRVAPLAHWWSAEDLAIRACAMARAGWADEEFSAESLVRVARGSSVSLAAALRYVRDGRGEPPGPAAEGAISLLRRALAVSRSGQTLPPHATPIIRAGRAAPPRRDAGTVA